MQIPGDNLTGWRTPRVACLKTYLNSRIAPKGLQIKLEPSMTTLSRKELDKWNAVLTNASLDLVKITIEHCETLIEVRRAQGNLLRDDVLSPHEITTLKLFEEGKRGQLMEIKEKKLARDSVKPLPKTMRGRDVPNSFDHSNIVNLSNVTLSPAEKSLLSRGLNFCPTTGQYDEFTLLQNLDNFERSL